MPAVVVMFCVVALLLQLNAYGVVPPLTVKLIVPLPPLQFTFVTVVDNTIAAGSVMMIESRLVHPWLSVKVTV